MIHINANDFRKNLLTFLCLAIDSNEVLSVNTNKGNIVIMSEDEYNGLTETLYLTSIPDMKERLTEGKDTKCEDCDCFEW